ncbi:hypothetical protein [Jutongia sp.]|uniref:hypothetical protein n=1 Tax=Jutongia sp. TaxID=2944204 RepID=UPI003079CC0C
MGIRLSSCKWPDCFHCDRPDCEYTGTIKEDNRYLTRLKLWSKYQHACEASSAARMAYENHHPEVVANEIYARTMHPLPMAAEKGEQDVFNTGNISHMHYGDNMDSPVTFISGNRGILPDAEKEVSR